MDINVRIDNYILNCRSVGIIRNKNKILFQKKINDKYFALPGGKIKIGEVSSDAIIREIYEELKEKSTIDRMHSVVENFFSFDDNKYHQYIYCYLLNIDSNSYIYNSDEFIGIEDKDIIFKWINIEDIDNEMVKPDYLKDILCDMDNRDIKFIVNDEISN